MKTEPIRSVTYMYSFGFFPRPFCSTMFRARASWSSFSKRLKPLETRSFCSKSHIQTNKSSNNGKINGDNKVEPDLSSYNDAYKQLDNLDLMTASKILFTQPSKKKKFGYHFLFSIFLFHVCFGRFYTLSGFWFFKLLGAFYQTCCVHIGSM